MEYSAWIDFLIKICCARFLIAPEEVNFQYGNTGQSQAMGQSPVEEKISASKDLGLRPLVRWFFAQLNQWYLQRVNQDFEVVAVGLDEKGPEAETDLLSKQVTVFLTVDEARERVELGPLGKENGGNMILNPTWMQYVQGQQAMAQQGGQEPPPESGNHFEVDDTRNDPFSVDGGEGGGEDGGGENGEGGEPEEPEVAKSAAKPIIKSDVKDLFDVLDERALLSSGGEDTPALVKYVLDL
jgi:hypothetical protein